MKKTFSKKLISCTLSLVLAVGFVPAGAFAAEKTGESAAPAAAEVTAVAPAASEQPAAVVPQEAIEAVSDAPDEAGEELEAQVEEEVELAPLTQDVYAEWPNFRGNSYNNGIVSYDLPADASEATLLWTQRLGTSYADAVSTQLIVDNYLVFMSGKKIYKANLYTGELVASGDLCIAFNWGYTPFAYGEGKIFVSLSTGTIQCFDATTLESLWVYKDSLKGQSVSPVVYSDGYVYTGFWNSEKKDANYVCIKAEDEDRTKGDELKEAVWSITNTGGYYWAGGMASGNYIVFGGDDGVAEGKSDGVAYLRSVNKYTGEVVSTLTLTSMGDQRSAICYAPETGQIYFTTKAGYLCSAYFNSSTGALSGLKSTYVWEGALSTSTPVYYKGKLYFGIGASYYGGTFCRFVVADASSLQTIASVEALGDVKASPLLSTATEDSGYLCFYFTYNTPPGGISLAKVKTDCSSNDDIELVELYDAAAAPQYNITSVISTSAGIMYVKNDSGTVFAVGFTDEGRTAANQRHAGVFEAAVEALFPVTLESGDAIAAVQSQLAGLSSAVRALVSQNALDRLDQAQSEYDALVADVEAAQEFTDAVAALFPVTEESGDAIAAARAMADALTDSQRAYVPDETFADLTRAETEYQALLVDDEQVVQVIQAIAALFPVTLDSGDAIQHVQDLLDALNVRQMEKVPQSVLDSYRDAKAQYQQLLDDKAVAEAFEAQVAALGQITMESGDAIAAAEEALAALTDQQRSLVSEETLAALADARASYDQLVVDHAVADDFVLEVLALGDITLDSGNAISAAEAALAKLTPEQRALVPATVITALSQARDSYNNLVAGKAAADKVSAMINDLGVVDLKSGDAIAACEAALAALTPEQASLVPSDLILKLQRSRKNYDKLVEESKKEKDNGEASGQTHSLNNDTKTDKASGEKSANGEEEEAVEEMIYTASLDNAPKADSASAEEDQQFPWMWVVAGGAALLVFAGAGRLRMNVAGEEDDEKDTE